MARVWYDEYYEYVVGENHRCAENFLVYEHELGISDPVGLVPVEVIDWTTSSRHVEVRKEEVRLGDHVFPRDKFVIPKDCLRRRYREATKEELQIALDCAFTDKDEPFAANLMHELLERYEPIGQKVTA